MGNSAVLVSRSSALSQFSIAGAGQQVRMRAQERIENAGIKVRTKHVDRVIAKYAQKGLLREQSVEQMFQTNRR